MIVHDEEERETALEILGVVPGTASTTTPTTPLLGSQLAVLPAVLDPYAPESHILPGVARADAFQKINKAGVVKSVAFYAYYAFCAALAGVSAVGRRLDRKAPT